MKKVAIALVLAVVAFAATSGLAQTITPLRADVPIAFSIDGRHYAAGPYQLRTIANHMILLSNAKTGDSGIVKLMGYDKGTGVNNPNPNLKFAVNGRRAYLMSLTDREGNTWKVRVAPSDLEASLLGAGTKTVIVAWK